MKSIILLITIFSSFLLSKELTFTQKEFFQIEKHPKKNTIKKRYEALNELIVENKNSNVKEQLTHINLFFNQNLPMLDTNQYNIDDHWSTPKEFLINGEGDCEDYVIAKYFTLLKLGIPKEDLYFAVVKLERRTDFHMVLLYNDKKSKQFLVMDNLSFRILSLEKRVDLEQVAAFNEFESRTLQNNTLGKIASIDWGEVNKWEELLEKVYVQNK